MYLIRSWCFVWVKVFEDIFYIRDGEMYLVRPIIVDFYFVTTFTGELFKEK
jgi:hypothetical protein